MSIDSTIQSIFGPFVDRLEAAVFYNLHIGDMSFPLIVAWLFFGGVFLTIWLKVRPIRDAKLSLKIIRGHYSRHSDPGEVTSFQALATELSGTVGLGNIAGVAVAISMGGPGATVWIIIAGLIGMALKMAEATLGQKFRVIHEDGTVSGGPMYYLRDGLKHIGKPKLGVFLGMIYAIGMAIAALGAGNIFQSNQVAAQIIGITGGDSSFFAGRGWILGAILAVLAGVVIIGGIQSIARWTSRLTPLMAVLYVVCVLVVLAVNFHEIPEAITTILVSGFTGKGMAGGLVGVAVIGIQRACFSNAAGIGTAGLAHSATKNKRPAEEGLVAAWEPFVDSVVICTMTALAIVVTGTYKDTSDDGVALTTTAFETVSSWFPLLLTVCIALFGFSTVLSFAYYGRKATEYVFPKSSLAQRGYDVIYVLFIIAGASVDLSTVVRFSDAMIFLVTLPNLLGIYFLGKVLRKELVDYRTKARRGEIEEVPLHERSTMLGEKMSEKLEAAGVLPTGEGPVGEETKQ